eukprot:Clim_evm36s128 gene=Clim_evmTU36s128
MSEISVIDDVRLFRSMFNAIWKRDGDKDEMEKGDARDLFMLPNDAYKTMWRQSNKVGADGDSVTLAAFDETLRGVQPSELYEASHQEKIEPFEGDPLDGLRARKEPLTLFLFSGLGHEMILQAPYEDIFSNPNAAFKAQWEEMVKDHIDQGDLWDFTHSLQKLGTKRVALDEWCRVTSLDDPDEPSRVLVRLILIRSQIGSVESMGCNRDSGIQYCRRINKICRLLGKVPDDMIFIGYSRGLPLALNMAVIANEENQKDWYPWHKNLRGIVSLGGPIYGSEMGDAAQKDESEPINHVLRTLEQLLQDLDYGDDDVAEGKGGFGAHTYGAVKGTVVNTAAIAKAAARLSRAPVKIEENFLNEGFTASSIPHVTPFMTMINQLFFQNFNASAPIAEYYKNMRRWKVLGNRILETAWNLSTEGSEDFWKKYTVPENYLYFSVIGTMGDAVTESSVIPEMTHNQTCYDAKSSDYLVSRLQWYDLKRFAKNMPLNDACVTVNRATFWGPAIQQSLNPKQKPYKSHLVCLANVNHFGMGMQYAVQDSSAGSPFPRLAFLFALSAFINQRIGERKAKARA